MLALIALLGPSIIGLKFLEHLLKEINIKNMVYYFTILLTLSLTLNNIISALLFKVNNVFNALNSYPLYFSKYVLVSLIINLLLALFLSVIIKYIKINVKVEKNEKKNK